MFLAIYLFSTFTLLQWKSKLFVVVFGSELNRIMYCADAWYIDSRILSGGAWNLKIEVAMTAVYDKLVSSICGCHRSFDFRMPSCTSQSGYTFKYNISHDFAYRWSNNQMVQSSFFHINFLFLKYIFAWLTNHWDSLNKFPNDKIKSTGLYALELHAVLGFLFYFFLSSILLFSNAQKPELY